MRRATASIASALVAPASAFAHYPATSYAAIDVAWSYEDPLPESAPIGGWLSFDAARAIVEAQLPHGSAIR